MSDFFEMAAQLKRVMANRKIVMVTSKVGDRPLNPCDSLITVNMAKPREHTENATTFIQSKARKPRVAEMSRVFMMQYGDVTAIKDISESEHYK